MALAGHRRYVFQSDGESSIVDLKRAVARQLAEQTGAECIPETSSKGDSSGNGLAEAAVKEIKAKVRTLVHAVRELHGTSLKADHVALPWIVQYAAAIMNRARRGEDGRTAWELRKGRQYLKPLCPFGEKVLYLPAGKKRSTLDSGYREGFFFGIVEGTEEVYIGTENGVFRARSYRRMPEDMRSDSANFDKIRGTPWDPVPGGHDADGASRCPAAHDAASSAEGTRDRHPAAQGQPEIQVHAEPAVPQDELPARPRGPDALPRQLYIRKAVELEKYGYTDGCVGCTAAFLNETAKPHTPECRARILEAMRRAGDTQRIEDADRKRALAVPAGPAATRQRCDDSEPGTSRKREREHDEGDVERVQGGHHGVGVDPVSGTTGATSSSGSGLTASQRQQQQQEVALQTQQQQEQSMDVNYFIDETLQSISALTETLMGVETPTKRIAEVFGDAGFSSRAAYFGLLPGVAVDLRTGWDMNDPVQVRRLWATLEGEPPLLVVGSPLCKPFSQLQRLNQNTHSEEYKKTVHEALEHLKLCMAIYKWQHDRGGMFLHEHPEGAWSWKLDFVQAILGMDGVMSVRGDQCPYGQMSKDELGEGLVLKPTRWMTNDPGIAVAVSRRCQNEHLPCEHRHRHVPLRSGRAGPCERYPPALVEAVLRAVKLKLQATGGLSVNNVDMYVGETVEEPEEDPQGTIDEWAVSTDDISYDQYTGLPLDAELVRAGRREEIKFMELLKVWTPATLEECVAETGAQPIPTKWVEHNKGDDDRPEVRCRLVAQETRRRSTIEVSDAAAVFSATPPLEAIRSILSLAMTTGSVTEQLVIRFLDISRAHPHCPVRRSVYVWLPPEAGLPHGMCAKLQMTMYGLRDAGQNFEFKVAEVMLELGYKQGVYNPCIYSHPTKKVKIVVHGDDFVVLGTRGATADFARALGQHLIVKDRGCLGPDRAKGDLQDIRILNRLVRWVPAHGATAERIEWEADPRHAELLWKAFGLKVGSKGVTTPGVKSACSTLEGAELAGEQLSSFKSLAMRAAYLAMDRPDLAFATKEVARAMARPTTGAWEALKRIARYLIANPRLVWLYERQEPRKHIDAMGDSNWAGCVVTRKSTSSTVLKHGKHLLAAMSTTQAVISLSSGEAEFYAAVKGASRVIGAAAMMADLLVSLQPRLWTDSSSAKGMASRRGAGKVRHIHTPALWLQQWVSKKRLELHKRKGTENEADLGTKHLDKQPLAKCLAAMNVEIRSDPVSGALKVQGS
jgi:hypothetical protein